MIKGNQKGFTIVEILVAVAISGMIASLIGTAIYQFFAVTDRGSDEIVALHDVQNAAHWLNIDGPEAVSATGGATLGLTLPDASTVTYAVSGTDLVRTAGAAQTTVARNVTALNFDVAGKVVTMTITSAPTGGWGVSQQKIYKVYLRPTG